MIQRYVVHKSEMHRVNADASDTAEWDLVVKYEDYVTLQKERYRLKAHLDALAYSVLTYQLNPDTEELAREVFEL